MKEVSMTRVLKPLLAHKKIVRKITKYFDDERDQEFNKIYLKRGNVSCYSSSEIEVTEYECTGNIELDAKHIDGWLDEILYTPEGLKEAIANLTVLKHLQLVPVLV